MTFLLRERGIKVQRMRLRPSLSELSKESPLCGEGLMTFLLRERGIKVQRMRLRDSIHHVDEKGVSER